MESQPKNKLINLEGELKTLRQERERLKKIYQQQSKLQDVVYQNLPNDLLIIDNATKIKLTQTVQSIDSELEKLIEEINNIGENISLLEREKAELQNQK